MFSYFRDLNFVLLNIAFRSAAKINEKKKRKKSYGETSPNTMYICDFHTTSIKEKI